MIMFAQHKQYYYIQGIYQRWHNVVLRHRVWYHHVLSWCTMVSEVKRQVVQENKLLITPSNITLSLLVARQGDVSGKLNQVFLLVDSFIVNFVDEERSEL